MTGRRPDRHDVYWALRDRLLSGGYHPGARLPSCRALAAELGTNSNTVQRALRMLQHEGVVRTVERRGTYVTDLTAARDRTGWLADEIVQLVSRAMTVGVDPRVFRELVDDALSGVSTRSRVLFVECNTDDLREMTAAAEGATGVSFESVLLDDLEAALTKPGDTVIAVPLFHFGEVRRAAFPEIPIVGLSFVPDSSCLLELASLDPSTRVTVASRSDRGVERLASLAHQYFGGDVEARLLTEAEADFSDVEILVYNNGSMLRAAELATAPATIKIESVLDGASAATLRQRIDVAVESNHAVSK
jgi:DNA-binding transcriptional regulator YhcF (GntR family)